LWISYERKYCVFKLAFWLTNTADECLGTPGEIFIPLQSALRMRFSDDIFRQLSGVVGIFCIFHQKSASVQLLY
uniref:Ovule protein n=1 Tax=Onchocerca flexuosa TaxID=387005 RepID=A0A183H0D4_9BILA